jgi:hypothetical protein
VKAPPDQRALLELLEADSIKDARRAVAALERDGYEWTPLGGKEGNFGLVNIGSDPGFAFVERITNALDAVIDEAARHAPAALVAELDSPRAAVAALFGIPEGRVVHCSAEAQAELAGAVTVRIGDGSSVGRPLLDVRDHGTGIAPDAMPATILNLAGSNKIAKPYLAGAYGQGGSTSFAFSPDGAVIASATADSPVGVTFVRFRELDARTNKNGRYEYLVRPGARGVGRLTRAAVAFERGTLVRHFDHDLERYRSEARLPDKASWPWCAPPYSIRYCRSRSSGECAFGATRKRRRPSCTPADSPICSTPARRSTGMQRGAACSKQWNAPVRFG